MDPDYSKTMAGDQALMESLEALGKSEAQVKSLTEQVIELSAEVKRLREASGRTGDGGGQDLQVKELLRVNHLWDMEYREQERAFEQYRIDSQQAQQENQAYIAKLKEEKDYLDHEIVTLKRQLSKGGYIDSHPEVEVLKRESAQKDHIIGNLKQKNRALEEQVSRRGPGVDTRRLKQLEEEIALLKQQVTAYKEDFEAERRDKERLAEEKRSVALRYEAELTSLKLQLDRCRNELQHYSTEATRLGQQLRLKQQYEEDQFKKHLESRGYVSRGSTGLPPLDPFVEHDPPSYAPPTVIEPPQTNSNSPKPAPRRNAPQRSRETYGNQLLARSSESAESVSAPASMGREQYYKPEPSRTLTPSSSPSHLRKQSHNSAPRVSGQNGYLQNGYSEHNGTEPIIRASSNPMTNGHPAPAYPPGSHSNGYIMQNGGVVPANKQHRVVVDSEESTSVSADSGISNGRMSPPAHSVPHRVNSDGHLNRMALSPPVEPAKNSTQEVEGQRTNNASKDRTQNSEVEVHKIPPMQTKGRHKCPRCARRFQHSSDCEDHKARCIS